MEHIWLNNCFKMLVDSAVAPNDNYKQPSKTKQNILGQLSQRGKSLQDIDP
jgi:hypothetical protein